MNAVNPRLASRRNLLIGFAAGVLSVAVFHQGAVFLLGVAGLGEGNVYSFRPTAPLGVPRLISQMFWGGLWGVVFAALVDLVPRRWPLIAAGLLFGIAGPVLFGLLVVTPLRGLPVTAALAPGRLAASLVINGIFGVGVAVFFAQLRNFVHGHKPSPRPQA